MKKFFAMTLALCLLLTTLVFPASALTAADFTDIPNNWAKPAIEYCLGKGLMGGVAQGTFNPTGRVTRAQIAQVLWNQEGKQSVEGITHPFTDANGWFHDAVVWCFNNGVAGGTSANTFTPNGPVTRQDICLMVYCYVKDYKKLPVELADETKMSSTYTDWGKAAKYAREALRWANKAGFMGGTSGTTLSPTGKATRAELAQFLKNLDKVLEKGEEPQGTPAPSPTPDKPQSTGSYRETYDFDETTMAAVDEDFWGFGETSNDMIAWSHASRPAVVSYTDKALATGVFDNPEYDKVIPAVPEGHTYKNFVPAGGWVENGSTYTVDIGGHTYTKATDGSTIYNRFGVDVTSVDGVMSEKERTMLHVMNLVCKDKHQLDGNYEGLYYDPVLQMAAEYMLEESKESADNYARAGLGELAAMTTDRRVTSSRKILDLSKKYDFANNSDLKKQARILDDLRMNNTEYMRTYYPNGLSAEDLNKFYAEVDPNTYDGYYYYDGRETSSSLQYASLYEYFGSTQIGEQYDSMVDNGTFQDFESITIRTPADRDYYNSVAEICQDGISKISSKFDNNHRYPAKIGIAYDEELHHWAILVCETHGNSLSSNRGRYHNTDDLNDNMGWYSAFITSEATEQ